MAEPKPNILIIQADQLAAPALSCYGHKVTKTPNIDSLAEGGVIFDSAYCNNPLCAPSRFSMLSGQHSSKIGAYDNGAEFPADIPTFAHYLRANGYRTTLCGKMHFVGADQLHGFEERLTTDVYPADHGWTPDWTRPTHRFDWWYHNMDSVYQAGPCERTNQIDFDDEVGFLAERHIYDLARDNDKRPFCMAVSFTDPHDPYACPKEYWDRYNHEDIDLPKVEHIDYEQCDPHSQRLRHACKMDRQKIDEHYIRNARHAYYGQISYIDDKIGRILKALEHSGLKENTVVIFTADHGDMLGERGLWYKMSFHEWSARVPFIVSSPQFFQPGRITTPVSLVDLLPTLLDLTADPHMQDPADRLDGNSLLTLLRGEAKEFKRPVISEYLGEGAVAPMIMVRQGRYKYIHSPADPPLLFDLEADPDELENLALESGHHDLCLEFEKIISEHQDLDELNKDILDSQKKRRLVFRAHMSGKHTSWDFQPVQDASQKYMRNHLNLNDVERCARITSKT
ncbi:choline-sulfatase [Desulfonatronovibrio hydrogenovorans]|uniref:choline-sulfatase n=1 Tax=Desulfonatronovibrio hydrogenovorans TaxID=53245 RepID=UPI00048C0B3C|nr:choline-sulfatase [Desulfonatronovibrio hydrogenovorans]